MAEKQVFISGTGCCLWGDVHPVERHDGGLVMTVTVEPLPDTSALVELFGVKTISPAYRNGRTPQARIARGAIVAIPGPSIDVIFDDDAA